MNKPANNTINYVEFGATDLKAVKKFYSDVFDWWFTDYGDTYTAFKESGLEGGFEQRNKVIANGVLVVIYHSDLESIKKKIVQAGGSIIVDVFSFPGGERFHFTDPSGNQLAVWRHQ